MAVPAEHRGPIEPSRWVVRFAHLAPPGEAVLDLAAGNGRHARHFLARDYRVVATDRDVSQMADLAPDRRIEIVEADLEDGGPFPFAGRKFGCIVVTNYLWRPLLPTLVAGLAEGGVLIYETFAIGNERLGKPRNPDHLLRRGELLDAVRGELHVIAYEHGQVETPRPAVVQRLVALRLADGADDAAADVRLQIEP